MKKSLLFFCALLMLGVSGVKADVTDLPEVTTDENNPKLYLIKNTRSNLYATYRSDTEQLRQIADITSATLWYFTAGTGTTNENQVSVKMRSYLADGKALNSVNLNAFNNTGVNVTIVKRPGADGVYLDMYSNNYNYDDGYHTAMNDGASTSITIWSAKDAGSAFVITPIDDILDDLKAQYSELVDGCETLTALFSSSDCTTAKTAISNATTGVEVLTAYEALLATANNKLITLKSYTGQKYIVLNQAIKASDSEESIIRVEPKHDLLTFQNPENGSYIGLSPTAQSTQFMTSTTPEYFQMKFSGTYSGYACFASSNARTGSGTLTMHQSGSNTIVTWYSSAENSFFLPASKGINDYKASIKAKLDAMSNWQPLYAAADITTAKSDVDEAATIDAINTIYEDAVKAANGKLLSIENYSNVGKYMSINATNVTTRTYPTVIKLLVNDDLSYSLQGYLNFESLYAEQLKNENYTYVASSTTAGKYRLGKGTKGFLFYSTLHDGCLHYSGGSIVRWYDNADASYWTISDVNDAAYLGSYYNALLSYQPNYGEYGYYKSGSMSKSYFDENIINTCAGVLEDLTTYAEYITPMKTAAKSAYDNVTAVVPVAGDFLRIKASDANKAAWSLSESNLYLTSSNCAQNVGRAGFAEGAATDNTTIFYYDGTYLTGYANGFQPTGTGTYAHMSIGGVGSTPTTIGFNALYGNEDRSYRVIFSNGNRALYTQRGGSAGSYYYHTDAAGSGQASEHYRYFLERVTTLPVSISAVGYATLYCPVALTIPGGITAYIASDEGDYLQLTAIDGGIIPANTGVILEGDEGTHNFAITTGGSAAGNELTGTVATITKPATAYYLSNGDKGLGFYKGGSATNMAGFKAYYDPGASVKGFLPFVFGDATGIKSIENGQSATEGIEIYNIAGQRVSKLQRGVNIVNGKKVLVK